MQYIGSLAAQLETLHLRRRTVYHQDDTELRPYFSESVLNLTFPKLHTFSLEGTNVYTYKGTSAEFWERHPNLHYIEARGDVMLPLIPSLDDDTFSGESILSNLRYLTV
jgi:hypothetical protein